MNVQRKRPSKEKVIAAIALMDSGFRDQVVIADAIGLQPDQIAEIESTAEMSLRKLALSKVPDDFAYFLRRVVRCPGCGHRITIAPCITCRITKRHLEQRRSQSQAE